eukprot:gene5923-11952_t
MGTDIEKVPYLPFSTHKLYALTPEFEGQKIKSYIDGKPVYYFPSKKKKGRQVQSFILLGVVVGMLIAAVVAIYVMRTLRFFSQPIASLINAGTIQFFNIVCTYVAYFLNDRENHRTQTKYEDHLAAKIFVFQFFNSYASFFYLAFIAQSLDECGDGSCMQLLAANLGIIFGFRLIVGNAISFVKRYVIFRLRLSRRGLEQSDLVTMPQPEREFLLVPYDNLDSSIEHYANAAILFGYTTIFITSLPLASLFACICEFATVKLDAWMLMKMFQRPVPQGAQDIGIWQKLFLLISIVAVSTNAGLVVFTMNVLRDWKAPGRFWVFIGFQAVCFGIQYLLDVMIPDDPKQFVIQRERNAFINSKIIGKEPDDIGDSDDGSDTSEKDGEGGGMSTLPMTAYKDVQKTLSFVNRTLQKPSAPSV